MVKALPSKAFLHDRWLYEVCQGHVSKNHIIFQQSNSICLSSSFWIYFKTYSHLVGMSNIWFCESSLHSSINRKSSKTVISRKGITIISCLKYCVCWRSKSFIFYYFDYKLTIVVCRDCISWITYAYIAVICSVGSRIIKNLHMYRFLICLFLRML